MNGEQLYDIHRLNQLAQGNREALWLRLHETVRMGWDAMARQIFHGEPLVRGPIRFDGSLPIHAEIDPFAKPKPVLHVCV